jgi:hypothetical protein
MAFGATEWDHAWDGNPAAAWAAGYGVLRWALNSSNTTGTGYTGWSNNTTTYTPGISVEITDQDGNSRTLSWSLSGANGASSQFCFLNADAASPLNGAAGSDSGTGKIGAPWQTLGKASGINGGAAAGAVGSICVLRAANAMYWLPPTANGGSAWSVNPTTGPGSYIQMPGDSGAATLDLTGQVSGSVPNASTAGSVIILPHSDTFFGGLSLYGYPGIVVNSVTLGSSAVANVRAFTWSNVNRLTFQGLTWNNSGYGSTSTNNATMFMASATSSPTQNCENIFCTGNSENGRQNSNNPNNAPLLLWYNTQNSLFELNWSTTPNDVGTGCDLKQDVGYTTYRANFQSANGGTGSPQIYGPRYYGCNYLEVSYNVAIGYQNINIGENGNQTFGPHSFKRNSSVIGGSWTLGSPTFNLSAPFTYFNTSAGGGSLFGSFIAAPVINTAAGSIVAGTRNYQITTLGVTGESGIGTDGQGPSTNSFTLTGSTNTITFTWWGAIPGNNGYNVYLDSTGTGVYNKFITLPPGTSSFTDDGSASPGGHTWQSTSGPPATSTALSAARFIFTDNLTQAPTQTSVPTGPTVVQSGNQFASSGLLNTTTGLRVVSDGGKSGVNLQ